MTSVASSQATGHPRDRSVGQPHPDDGNQVWVSVHKRPSLYVDIALRMFKQHEIVELRGLGAALAATIEVAEQLLHLRRATLQSIKTSTSQSKAELTILLQRSGQPTGPEHTEDEAALIQLTEDTHMTTHDDH